MLRLVNCFLHQDHHPHANQHPPRIIIDKTFNQRLTSSTSAPDVSPPPVEPQRKSPLSLFPSALEFRSTDLSIIPFASLGPSTFSTLASTSFPSPALHTDSPYHNTSLTGFPLLAHASSTVQAPALSPTFTSLSPTVSSFTHPPTAMSATLFASGSRLTSPPPTSSPTTFPTPPPSSLSPPSSGGHFPLLRASPHHHILTTSSAALEYRPYRSTAVSEHQLYHRPPPPLPLDLQPTTLADAASKLSISDSESHNNYSDDKPSHKHTGSPHKCCCSRLFSRPSYSHSPTPVILTSGGAVSSRLASTTSSTPSSSDAPKPINTATATPIALSSSPFNSSAPTESRLAQNHLYSVGDKVAVRYSDHNSEDFYDAYVLRVNSKVYPPKYYVHYIRWNEKYDEWVDEDNMHLISHGSENHSSTLRKRKISGSAKKRTKYSTSSDVASTLKKTSRSTYNSLQDEFLETVLKASALEYNQVSDYTKVSKLQEPSDSCMEESSTSQEQTPSRGLSKDASASFNTEKSTEISIEESGLASEKRRRTRKRTITDQPSEEEAQERQRGEDSNEEEADAASASLESPCEQSQDHCCCCDGEEEEEEEEDPFVRANENSLKSLEEYLRRLYTVLPQLHYRERDHLLELALKKISHLHASFKAAYDLYDSKLQKLPR